jgi:hypothetical protein
MALTVNKEIGNTGLIGNELYAKITNTAIQNTTKLSFTVEYFKDKTKDNLMVSYFNCPYDIDGANPIKQAYLHLKTLPEFADATDI